MMDVTAPDTVLAIGDVEAVSLRQAVVDRVDYRLIDRAARAVAAGECSAWRPAMGTCARITHHTTTVLRTHGGVIVGQVKQGTGAAHGQRVARV